MTQRENKKRGRINDIMSAIHGAYTEESGVYIKVASALNKLTQEEIASMHSMMMTANLVR